MNSRAVAVVLVGAVSSLQACSIANGLKGKKDGDKNSPKVEASTPDLPSSKELQKFDATGAESLTGSATLQDHQAASVVVTAQIEDAISSIMAGDLDGVLEQPRRNVHASSKRHSDSKNQGLVSRTSLCSVDSRNGSAIVQGSFSGSKTFNVKRDQELVSLSLNGTGAQTHQWLRDGSQLACSKDNRNALIALNQLDGLELNIDFTREKIKAFSYQSTGANGTRLVRSVAFNAKGTRTVLFANIAIPANAQSSQSPKLEKLPQLAKMDLSVLKPDDQFMTLVKYHRDRKVECPEQGPISYGRSITTSTDVTLLTDNAGGKKQILEYRNSTEPGELLRIDSARRAERLGDEVGFAVKSGTLNAVFKDGSKIQTRFVDVKFNANLDSELNCDATSGRVEGSLFAAGANTPSRTFVIDFAASPTRIVFNNGESAPLVLQGCDLEDPIR